MEALPSDRAAVATVKEKITGRQPVDELAKITERRWQYAVTPYEEPRAEPSNTKKEHLDVVENETSVEAVEAAKEIDDIPELDDEDAIIQQD
jgi:hypothetical protein